MWKYPRSGLRVLGMIALGGALAFGARLADAQVRPARSHATSPTFTVDGQLALHSIMSLSDAHLQKLADVLRIVATSDAARSCEWDRIRVPLAEAAQVNIPAVLWFALPNGSYWTVAQGRAAANLSDRTYFPRVLAGKTVIGDLVVSRSTNRNSAIVAVPVRGEDGSVVGVVGSSVHLDSLSALVRQEMGGLGDGLFFFAIDSAGLGAVHSDSTLIFTEPIKLGDEGMRRAFREMLSGHDGVVVYTFRGGPRTVLYRKSPVTGWWYGFGAVVR